MFILYIYYTAVLGGTCKGEAVQLWLITRHGTRYPTKSLTERLLAILPLVAEELVFNSREGRGKGDGGREQRARAREQVVGGKRQ